MSLLFSPITIRTLTLENRLMLPAMVTRLSGEDGVVNEDIRKRYVRFAKGHVGLIVVEAMAVHSAKSGPLLPPRCGCSRWPAARQRTQRSVP